MTIQSLYPWESPDLVAEEDAELGALHAAAREAWLDDLFADIDEELAEELATPVQPQWLTDWQADVAEAVATVAAPGYVPFQDAGPSCRLDDEIGYAESVTPWLY